MGSSHTLPCRVLHCPTTLRTPIQSIRWDCRSDPCGQQTFQSERSYCGIARTIGSSPSGGPPSHPSCICGGSGSDNTRIVITTDVEIVILVILVVVLVHTSPIPGWVGTTPKDPSRRIIGQLARIGRVATRTTRNNTFRLATPFGGYMERCRIPSEPAAAVAAPADGGSPQCIIGGKHQPAQPPATTRTTTTSTAKLRDERFARCRGVGGIVPHRELPPSGFWETIRHGLPPRPIPRRLGTHSRFRKGSVPPRQVDGAQGRPDRVRSHALFAVRPIRSMGGRAAHDPVLG